ncbi:PAS domain S-box-containing protein [Actinoplanes derwentensis]|uniref:PAS domain S-box-containing protein n=2 Tax=Actinoplanes derwentensis TaxID=113562 RepID=A0A1H1VQC0_9ACTN|nr:PAS domain S-box-containing protein [Actinoplanes derwentensis]
MTDSHGVPMFSIRSAADGTRRALSSAIVVLTISSLLSLGHYLGDWYDVLAGGGTPKLHDWVALAGMLWLLVVAATVRRLMRVHRDLAETAQTATEAFHDAASSAQGWVWRIDTDYRYTYSNPAVEAMLGYRPDQIIGNRSIDLFFLPEDQAAIRTEVNASRVSNGWQNRESRMLHRDGSIRHVRSSATAVHDRDGRLIAYQGSTADITAEYIARTAAEAATAHQTGMRDRTVRALRDPAALQILFQPIHDLHTGRIAGYEALSRFAGTPYRTPDVWFAEAWQAGLGIDLELHAITLAVRQLELMPPTAYLSVNAAPQTILDDRFAALLTGLGPDAARIVVEVTEHAAVADYDTLAAAVQRLRRTGVRFAVDDTGAGYASMQHVLRLRPDVIKLDRGIVAGIDLDVARQALATAMVTFAASLGMSVVGEGIETAGELAALTQAGVRNGQGYFLGRPAPLTPAYENAA